MEPVYHVIEFRMNVQEKRILRSFDNEKSAIAYAYRMGHPRHWISSLDISTYVVRQTEPDQFIDDMEIVGV